ncbi:MAG: peptide chain release factor N(5)-glutamine methyltransferase [Paracoccaceae bacterium]|nr:peptide chain release factor N(5)-glutamine methyltransferase [Paracoccaceae bacterium]
MTGQEALMHAIPRLRAAGIDGAARDARLILAHAMELEASRLTLHLHDVLTDAQYASFDSAIARREERVPVSQIIGGRAFYGHWFKVTRNVLDPRPETELLIETALERPFDRVLDLGTGTGCIILSLLAARPESTGVASDISADALEIAKVNADLLAVAGRVSFVRSDWYESIEGTFNLIVSNPPYIAADEMADLSPEVKDHEPHLALTDFGDGLDAYRAIAAVADDYLTPDGRILVEIGPTQAQDVSEIFETAGFAVADIRQDLDGRDRVLAFVRP